MSTFNMFNRGLTVEIRVAKVLPYPWVWCQHHAQDQISEGEKFCTMFSCDANAAALVCDPPLIKLTDPKISPLK